MLRTWLRSDSNHEQEFIIKATILELHDVSRPMLIVATRRHDEQDGHNPGWVVQDHHGRWGDDQAAAAPRHLCRLGNQLREGVK